MVREKREASLLEAFIPILFLIIFLTINVAVFGDAALDGSNQIVLILSAAVASLMAIRLGFNWDEILGGITKSIHSAMPSILILLMIGSLAGSWLISGIVPAMIYYGLLILNPTIFLFAACVVCAIVSMATGSSWTTSATVGIALIGIGQTMGIHEGLVAGAILSGAYFGDKMSPLSDTTNLAPAMAGTDLFTHIRYMAYTTVPSIVITLIVFLVWGFTFDSASGDLGTASVLSAIQEKFYISWELFIVPALVIFMIVRKVPALPALLIGALLGIVFALIFQPNIVAEVSSYDGASWKVMFVGSMKALYGSVGVTTSHEMVNELLSSGGMYGMLNTIWLIISAMVFGGVMESSGMLRRIARAIISVVNSTGSLIASTAGTCVFFNVTASDQYLAIVVPGRMYADIYKDKGLAPENLSRTLEDSGTVTSVLIPWNTCGAYHSSVLGVGTLTFAPYCFFNIISPLMTVLFGYLNIKIRRLTKKED
ncbi:MULTISPECIES: Na+/H+ antiporter NhaC [Reichenbachiella]|uniref:Na+:H+ antiporter, NhaC family n=1 Tax=Reichenbachiella agariperforans TaxID=156994 RepID=A0A1M6KZ24_REIAG|nr:MULTISPECIES: Na+/H+ antiporter NhaC [Reichenbachiella]MBU2913730.1 Na+/H+ antiporter NhaC [Reichenbachiella agariperforans]RJE74335.1 Na+/H+ antiporter NhaC [Reichenbachiella sp. MSK19-1]SHJ64253.1 Na+:H+ antiporter, NhaC family [Reichenbachiella agariperforans]